MMLLVTNMINHQFYKHIWQTHYIIEIVILYLVHVPHSLYLHFVLQNVLVQNIVYCVIVSIKYTEVLFTLYHFLLFTHSTYSN